MQKTASSLKQLKNWIKQINYEFSDKRRILHALSYAILHDPLII